MKRYIVMLGCIFLLAGCTKSNIVNPTGKIEPNFDVVEGIKLDDTQIKEDMEGSFDSFDLAEKRGFEYSLDDAEETLTLILSVEEGTAPNDAAALATYMISAYNEAVATQDFSYENSSEGNYGGYFNTHDVHVRVIPDVPDLEESMWIVDQVIKAGENTPVTPLK